MSYPRLSRPPTFATRALVLVSWLKALDTADPKACEVFRRFKQLDTDHPA